MPLKPLSRSLAEPGGAQAHHLHDTGLELTSVTRRRPHQQASCCHLLCLPSQLLRRSRAETPEGSQPAFAWGDLTRRLNPYPSDYGAAFASSLLLYPPSHQQPPCGGPTPRGGRRAYHVPRMYHGWFRLWLSADGSTATAGEREPPAPGHLPFWFKPVSAFGLLEITAFISSSPELAMPSALAPDRLGAGSCRVLSREPRPPGSGEVTLSQELRTVGLLRPHVLVGYQWSHAGLCPGCRPVITDTSAASCRTPSLFSMSPKRAILSGRSNFSSPHAAAESWGGRGGTGHPLSGRKETWLALNAPGKREWPPTSPPANLAGPSSCPRGGRTGPPMLPKWQDMGAPFAPFKRGGRYRQVCFSS